MHQTQVTNRLSAMTSKTTTAKPLKQASAVVKVTDYINVADYLKNLYLSANSEESKYSYRQFSEDLGFSKTNIVHLYVQGKRKISAKAAQKILEKLNLSSKAANYFITLCELQNTKDKSKLEDALSKSIELKDRLLNTRLEKAQLDYYSSYWHPIIRELINLKEFKEDYKWIAKKVYPNIRPKQAQESIELLLELDLIKRDKNNKLSQNTKLVSSGHDVFSLALKKYHAEAINMGVKALLELDASKRFIGGATVRLSSVQFQLLKQKLDKVLDEVLAMEGQADNKPEETQNIVQFNIQAFPATLEQK